MNANREFWRVEMLSTGLSAGALGKRCSFNRALRICETSRDQGAVWCMVLDPKREYVCGVWPWDSQMTDEQFLATIAEAQRWLALTDNL